MNDLRQPVPGVYGPQPAGGEGASPTLDEMALDALTPAYGRNVLATYVIANTIRTRTGKRPPTYAVRAALRRLERAGKVELAPTHYANMLEWRVVSRPTPAEGEG